MNRIALAAASGISIASEKSKEQVRETHQRLFSTEFATDELNSVVSSVFVPMHYERKYAYPLLVWLHPNGGHEHQLRRVMRKISLRNYAAVAPRATHACPSAGNSPVGYAWEQTSRGILGAWKSVEESIHRASDRFHLAENRVFIGGYREGGTMAMRLAFAHPDRFAGVFSLGGPFPKYHQPLKMVKSSRSLPAMIAFGHNSMHYCQDQVCRDLRLLHTAGASLTVRQYVNRDELSDRMLADVDRWVMRIVTGEHDQEVDGFHYFTDSDEMCN